MTLNELREDLAEVKLELVMYNENIYSIGSRAFANPMLFFDVTNKGKNYNGTIDFKAINNPLFTAHQIVTAIELVNGYLQEVS